MSGPGVRRPMSLRELCACAMFAALLCVCSVITIPLNAIPITLSTFALALTGLLLPLRCAVPSVAVYLLLGLCGLPVFSGGGSGFGVLLGPTGGYLWSYPLMAALIAGLRCCTDRTGGRQLVKLLLICEAGMALCYLCGTIQYSVYAHISFLQALRAAVVPFLLVDFLKFLLAACIALRLERVTENFFQ